MQHPEEGTIHAWLDGALPADEAAAVEAHVTGCGECAARVAEARGLIAGASRIVGALDVIPSGVIPARRPARTAWYMSNQLRAAAAVLIVAAGSLLVMRGSERTQRERSVTLAAKQSQPASQPASPPASQPTLAAAPVSEPAAITKVKTKSNDLPAVEKANDESLRRSRKNAAPVIAQQAPAPAAATSISAAAPNVVASSAPAEADLSKAARTLKRDSAVSDRMLSNVVVTGVAATTIDKLKQLRADTTAIATTTVFEVSPGVEVTLVESHARGFIALRTGVATTAGKAAAQAPAPPPAAPVPADEAKPAINSISWTDKRGRQETLSGRLSKADLEAIRRLLPPDKR